MKRPRSLLQNSYLFFANVRRPLCIGAVFLFFLTSYTHAGDAPSYGDAFVSASIGDARTLVPVLASDSDSGSIVGYVFNGLVKYDKDIKLVGDLAKSWEIKNGGLTIIFHLRDDVRWHDGIKNIAMPTRRHITSARIPMTIAVR